MNTISHNSYNDFNTKELIIKYNKNRSEKIKKDIIQQYKFISEKLADTYSDNKDQFEELYIIAIDGLVKSIDSYDINGDLDFSKHTVIQIINEIKLFSRSKRVCKIK